MEKIFATRDDVLTIMEYEALCLSLFQEFQNKELTVDKLRQMHDLKFYDETVHNMLQQHAAQKQLMHKKYYSSGLTSYFSLGNGKSILQRTLLKELEINRSFEESLHELNRMSEEERKERFFELEYEVENLFDYFGNVYDNGIIREDLLKSEIRSRSDVEDTLKSVAVGVPSPTSSSTSGSVNETLEFGGIVFNYTGQGKDDAKALAEYSLFEFYDFKAGNYFSICLKNDNGTDVHKLQVHTETSSHDHGIDETNLYRFESK